MDSVNRDGGSLEGLWNALFGGKMVYSRQSEIWLQCEPHHMRIRYGTVCDRHYHRCWAQHSRGTRGRTVLDLSLASRDMPIPNLSPSSLSLAPLSLNYCPSPRQGTLRSVSFLILHAIFLTEIFLVPLSTLQLRCALTSVACPNVDGPIMFPSLPIKPIVGLNNRVEGTYRDLTGVDRGIG